MVEKRRGRSGQSFIEEARRKQLIEVALQVIAKNGFNNTTLQAISENAHVSKGVISYYFCSKKELIDTVLIHILTLQKTNRNQFIEGKTSASEKLKAYIQADILFLKHNPELITALLELWNSFSTREDKRQFETFAYEYARQTLQGIFKEGQDNGEFNDFDRYVMACIVQASIDGLMTQWLFNPSKVDWDRTGESLLALFMGFVSK
jgi:TetR/AcrR family transcriptional regulator, fatty acid metabolism regulator protein